MRVGQGAFPSLDCAGERALLVTEEDAFGERRRDRSAIDDHEWTVLARARFVDRLGHDLLSGTGLTQDQIAQRRRGNLLEHGVDAPHLGARAHESANAI